MLPCLCRVGSQFLWRGFGEFPFTKFVCIFRGRGWEAGKGEGTEHSRWVIYYFETRPVPNGPLLQTPMGRWMAGWARLLVTMYGWIPGCLDGSSMCSLVAWVLGIDE